MSSLQCITILLVTIAALCFSAVSAVRQDVPCWRNEQCNECPYHSIQYDDAVCCQGCDSAGQTIIGADYCTCYMEPLTTVAPGNEETDAPSTVAPGNEETDVSSTAAPGNEETDASSTAAPGNEQTDASSTAAAGNEQTGTKPIDGAGNWAQSLTVVMGTVMLVVTCVKMLTH